MSQRVGKLLHDGVEHGESAPRHNGVGDKLLPQQLPAHEITDCVHHQSRYRRGESHPVVQEQGHAQHTALGHTGQGMDIVQAEGKNGAAQQGQGTFLRLYEGKQNNNSFDAFHALLL